MNFKLRLGGGEGKFEFVLIPENGGEDGLGFARNHGNLLQSFCLRLLGLVVTESQ